jgi:predicted nucleotide-binding protein
MQRNRTDEGTRTKPRLFIGSSTEGLIYADAVQDNLQREADVTVWDQGIFELSQGTMDGLLKELDNSDYAVFIFSPDEW